MASSCKSLALAAPAYSTKVASTSPRASTHRNVGVPKSFPWEMISRRDIGKGVVENSMPRAHVRRFQGGVERANFSSQIPSQGKSERWKMYPTAKSSLELVAVNHARSDGVSKSCAVKSVARRARGG